MRRSAILALASAVATAAALAVSITPAAAHICPLPAQIPVGRTATIDIGVTVENATVPDVEIDVPIGLHLDRVDQAAGWTSTRTSSTVRYHGGPIAAFTCKYFSLGVTAAAKGAFGVPVVQRTATGEIVSRTTPDPNSPSDRVLDQFVYAGVKPPANPGGSSGPSVTTIAGIALVGLGALGALVIGVRAWRNRGPEDHDDDDGDLGDDGDGDRDRDRELRARLEQFKKRKSDPPARPTG